MLKRASDGGRVLTSLTRARVKKNLRAARSALALTVGAEAHERQVDGLGLEARAARGGADELGRLREVEVHELAAARADGVVVARGLAVVAARPLAEVDLAQEPRPLEILQRVVDRGEADRGQLAPRRLENLVGRQVLGRLRDDAEHGLPLR